jgi:hypothetical protein
MRKDHGDNILSEVKRQPFATSEVILQRHYAVLQT